MQEYASSLSMTKCKNPFHRVFLAVVDSDYAIKSLDHALQLAWPVNAKAYIFLPI
jgi:hypothetical protein